MWLKFPAGATPFKDGRERGVWCLVISDVISGKDKSCQAFMQISDTIIACYRVYPEVLANPHKNKSPELINKFKYNKSPIYIFIKTFPTLDLKMRPH